MVGSRLAGIRVFTLGIDRAVNEGFLHRLAELGKGGGSCELVESDERLDAVMESIHRRIDAPILTDVTLDAGQAELEIMADSLVPERPPAVFAGSPLLVLGRYRGRPQRPLFLRKRRARVAPTPKGSRQSCATTRRSRRPGAGPGALSRRPLRSGSGRPSKSRARDHRHVAAVWRFVPLHGLRGDRSRGGCK